MKSRKIDWAIAGILGVVAAVVYFASLAGYAYPGESARLLVLWKGLETGQGPVYPLMAVFAKLLGGGNALAPICGTLAVMAVFALATAFARRRVGEGGVAVSRLSGVVAALVFMLTPAVRSAATHLAPELFDALWALLALLMLVPISKVGRGHAGLVLVMGASVGVGLCDSALFVALIPLCLGLLAWVLVTHGKKPYGLLVLFIAAALAAYLISAKSFGLTLGSDVGRIADGLHRYHAVPGWVFIAVFATIPFALSLFSSRKAYGGLTGVIPWLFHLAMSSALIIAVATPLSPSSVMEPFGVLPVVSSAFVAFVAGYLLSFWWFYRTKMPAMAVWGALTLVLAVSCLWNLFSFDGRRGAFADRVAQKIVADLGEREWLVTDGTLDNHLRLAAAEAGRELNLVQLSRDPDESYRKSLAELVREKKLGGANCESLALSLSIGVLQFVQDWLAGDPQIAKKAAVYGSPDIWQSAGLKPVPEFLFSGADAARPVDWNAWNEFDAILSVPKGWGSYSGRMTRNPVDRLRNSIRRQIGLLANNRGVYLQDQKRDDAAFEMYEKVLNEIDGDNVCALINEIEMANAKHPKAVAKQNELKRRLEAIGKDKGRRYYIWQLGRFYGYVRNPDMFVRLGVVWARSGRPGEALAQIRRAIDFVPDEGRVTLLNMMAALYASENDRQKSREIYEGVLARDAKNHDALIGLMKIELQSGNQKKAIEYLAKASEAKSANTKVEKAMMALIKNDFATARSLLKAEVDANPKNIQAWSMLATTVMQQYDMAKDAKAKAALLKEIEDSVLPLMEKHSGGSADYHVQMTRAFVLMRKGADRRREARDAFSVAARLRPDIPATQDIVMGLDISLNDPADAERQARDVLRRNRNAPLANYVMGSLALSKEDYRTAEGFLRKAVDTEKPVILALNDLAEVLRRGKKFAEAERHARKATELAPHLYVAWETLGSVLLDMNARLDEAEACIRKACELSKGKNGREADIRMLISLARVQLRNGDKSRARGTIRKVQAREKELSAFEKNEFEELKKRAR